MKIRAEKIKGVYTENHDDPTRSTMIFEKKGGEEVLVSFPSEGLEQLFLFLRHIVAVQRQHQGSRTAIHPLRFGIPEVEPDVTRDGAYLIFQKGLPDELSFPLAREELIELTQRIYQSLQALGRPVQH